MRTILQTIILLSIYFISSFSFAATFPRQDVTRNQPCNGHKGEYVLYKDQNGNIKEGGFVAKTATVEGKRIRKGNYKGRFLLDSAILDANVQICKQASVMDNVKISGNVIITDQAIIQHEAQLIHDPSIAKKYVPTISQMPSNTHSIISGSTEVSHFSILKGIFNIHDQSQISDRVSLKGIISSYGESKIVNNVTLQGQLVLMNNTVLGEQVRIKGTLIADGFIDIVGTSQFLGKTSIFYKPQEQANPITIDNDTTFRGITSITTQFPLVFSGGEYIDHVVDCSNDSKPAYTDWDHYQIEALDPLVSRVSSPQDETCSICLDNLNGNGAVVETLSCHHTFHRHCLFESAIFKTDCPLCRHSLSP